MLGNADLAKEKKEANVAKASKDGKGRVKRQTPNHILERATSDLVSTSEPSHNAGSGTSHPAQSTSSPHGNNPGGACFLKGFLLPVQREGQIS